MYFSIEKNLYQLLQHAESTLNDIAKMLNAGITYDF